MKKNIIALVLCLICCGITTAQRAKPWDNGRLKVSDNHRYLIHENGTPFFWLGNTAWLISERLTRDEVEYYLVNEHRAGYNVEQIQVINSIPTFNIYGQQANDASFDMWKFSKKDQYGYWEHLDFIVDFAASQGIYIAMDCVWGSQITKMDIKKAEKYGQFLGERYKDKPNIIWMIGGDVLGDKGTASWDALAKGMHWQKPSAKLTPIT